MRAYLRPPAQKSPDTSSSSRDQLIEPLATTTKICAFISISSQLQFLSAEDAQIVSMFAGTVFLKDESTTDTSPTKRMANIMYTNLDAGDHTLKVDASMELLNNNPGGYEVQIFVPNYDPGMTYDGLVEGLYP